MIQLFEHGFSGRSINKYGATFYKSHFKQFHNDEYGTTP